MDELVRKHVLENRLNADPDLIERINGALNAPRILDEPPVIKLGPVDVSYTGGVRETFKKMYSDVMRGMDPNKPCSIQIRDKSVSADISVVCALKTLLVTAVSIDKALALACKALFVSITFASMEHITKELMLSKLLTDSYYTGELSRAIEEAVA
jgi:hypothetical protein